MEPSQQLYLVGEFYEEDDKHGIVGLFSTEEKAIKACRTTNHWFMPLSIDTTLPLARTDGIVGVDTFYPLCEAIS